MEHSSPSTINPTKPKSILDPNFKYIPSAQTDVQRTWMKYGWKPTERKEQTDEHKA